MKFVSFNVDKHSSFGIVTDAGIFDLGARIGKFVPTLQAYLEAAALGLVSRAAPPATADYKTGDVTYEPVIGSPRKIICVGLNYEAHRLETGRKKFAYPALFTRFADTLVGHEQPIRRPAVSEQLDYEGELAVVIGRPAHQIPREHALGVVAGYTCFNDASVRDWQNHNSQFTPGKNFPGTGPLGPWLVTPDEIDDLGACTIESRLNGAVMQSAALGDMTLGVPELIAYISTFTALNPGDVIATGTPGGVGFKREPPVFMKAGDRIEVIIARIGHLVNRVTDDPRAG
jgi:2-keto-4-pentenoate hydratase/2-oxohepta-3-ene-1,7-dioic acid hydratase in catechol pathway